MLIQAAEMFYFYFESRKDPKNDPVVLWMTGATIANFLRTSLPHALLVKGHSPPQQLNSLQLLACRL